MIPNLILNYNDFLEASRLSNRLASLFWIVEYNPDEVNEKNYNNSINRFTLMRNECLAHPNDFIDRLNQHIYRIWTDVPNINMPW